MSFILHHLSFDMGLREMANMIDHRDSERLRSSNSFIHEEQLKKLIPGRRK